LWKNACKGEKIKTKYTHLVWVATFSLLLLNALPVFAQNQVQAASVRAVENLEKRVFTLEAPTGRNVTTPTARTYPELEPIDVNNPVYNDEIVAEA
jgi:hypothetical protein